MVIGKIQKVKINNFSYRYYQKCGKTKFFIRSITDKDYLQKNSPDRKELAKLLLQLRKNKGLYLDYEGVYSGNPKDFFKKMLDLNFTFSQIWYSKKPYNGDKLDFSGLFRISEDQHIRFHFRFYNVAIYGKIVEYIEPYTTGMYDHPSFLGWIHKKNHPASTLQE